MLDSLEKLPTNIFLLISLPNIKNLIGVFVFYGAEIPFDN